MPAKMATLIVFIIFFYNNSALSQVLEEWVATIPQEASNQRALKLAIDNLGQPHLLIYDVGNGVGPDLLLVKYDENGIPLWETRYNGPANSGGFPVALWIDDAGNVIVSASDGGGEPDPADRCHWSPVDYVTIKYDSNGNQLWASRFNGPSRGADGPAGVLVDPAGNVYVTGTSYVSSTCTHVPESELVIETFNDFVTIKYDTDGNPLWERRFVASHIPYAQALSLAPGDDNSLYVLGRIGSEIVVVKYDSEGNELWTGSIQGRSPAYIAADAFGNAYITAWSFGDKPIAKFAANGQLIWQTRIENWSDIAGMVLDNENNVYVGGSKGAIPDYVVSKWDMNGSHLWTATYLKSEPPYPNEQATAITIDAAGNIYLTGYSYATLEPQDITTVKFTSDGNIAWGWNSPPDARPDARNNFYAIAVDSLQNVYIGGSNSTNAAFEYALFKLSQNSGTPGDGSSPTASGGGGGGGGGGCFVSSALR